MDVETLSALPPSGAGTVEWRPVLKGILFISAGVRRTAPGGGGVQGMDLIFIAIL